MRKILVSLLAALLFPAGAQAETIAERVEAAYPIAVKVGPCAKRRRWTDCYVNAPLEESGLAGVPDLLPEWLQWRVRVFPHRIIELT